MIIQNIGCCYCVLRLLIAISGNSNLQVKTSGLDVIRQPIISPQVRNSHPHFGVGLTTPEIKNTIFV